MKKKSPAILLVTAMILLSVALFAGYNYMNGAFQSESAQKQTQKSNPEERHSKKTDKVQTTKETKTDALGNEDFTTMKRPSVEEVNHAQGNLSQASAQFVGTIDIPKIGLQLHILEGCTYENMLYAATTLMPNEVMGTGNYALASHNMGVEHSMFTSIYQLQTGDDIFLTNQEGQKFHYQVTENQVVDFRNTQCLEDKEQPVVTLVTCQSVQTTPNRVVVQGTLVND